MVTWIPLVVLGAAVLGLAVAALYARLVLREDPGNERMRYISRLIQRGAITFINREIRYVVVYLAAMILLISLTLKNGWMISLCFLFGAACALLAGYIGLMITTRANARTTEAARSSVSSALSVAFKGGSVIGLTVTGLGLLGVSACFLVFESAIDLSNSSSTVLGFALGAASVALFLRVGGGIFTKGADVGADLVGKVEEGIPEDDPRNPAVIADNVGDNVGDVAGMGSDLNASLIAAIAAPIVVASTGQINRALGDRGMLLPLAIGAVGVVCTIVGTLFIRKSSKRTPGKSVALAMGGTAVLVTVASFFVTWGIVGWKNIMLFLALLIGILAGVGLAFVSGYFTSSSFKPVRRIVEAAMHGAGTTVISGLSEGMMSTLGTILLLAVASGVSFIACRSVFDGAGIYGVSLIGIGMLSMAGIVVATDSFGCVADNAGGIAEMAQLDEVVRERTDELDALGNTTAAVSKGFAIGAAGLVVISLLAAYADASKFMTIKLIDENTILGLLLGAMAPLVFSALAMRGVQVAAHTVVEEVRRQFREIPGLREGKPGVEPDYSLAIDMTARTAVHQMLIPALFVFLLPFGIGLLLGLDSLAGFLAGALVGGLVSGVWMVNAGGAWDNAKKYIEAGNYGGKGTATHAASVVGDTVGDPLKDTSGPAMNIIMKVMALTALIFVPLFH